MGEVIERGGVGVVELERRDGDCAVTDGGHVRVGLDAFDELLLMEPIVAAAARVGAGLEQVARDF